MTGLNIKELLCGDPCRMAHIVRYSSHRTIRPENVAEHSWYTTFYGLVIGEDLLSRGYDLDILKLMKRLVVHDLDEALTGDFVRTFKYATPQLKEEIDKAAVELLKSMLDTLGARGTGIYESWINAKAPDLEGAVAKLCDFLSVVSYAYGEFMSGNKFAKKIFEEVVEWINLTLRDFSDENFEALIPYVGQVNRILAEVPDLDFLTIEKDDRCQTLNPE